MLEKAGQLRDKLYQTTILARHAPSTFLPEPLVNFFQSMSDPSDDDPHLSAIKNPYQYAKERINRLYNPPEITEQQSPVEQMRSARGIISSFWTSEKRRAAWGKSAGLGALSVANGLLPVGTAYQGAEMMNSLMQTGISGDFGQDFAKLMAIAGVWAGGRAASERTANSLHRDLTHHIRTNFAKAAAERPEIFAEIAKNTNAENHNDDPENVSVAHAMFKAPSDYAEKLILRESGKLNVVVSLAAVGGMLLQNSVPIELLDNMAQHLNNLVPGGNMDLSPGDKGSFIAALTVSGLYTAFTKAKGKALGQKMEAAQNQKEASDSRVEEHLTQHFHNKSSDGAPELSYEERLQRNLKFMQENHDAKLKNGNFMEIAGLASFPLSVVPSMLSIWSPQKGLSTQNTDALSNFWGVQASTLVLLDKLSEAIELATTRSEKTVPLKHINDLAEQVHTKWIEQDAETPDDIDFDQDKIESEENIPEPFNIT